MRLLVTGSRGQLGRALGGIAREHGHDVTGLDLPELDITDAAAVDAAVAGARPEAIINCAAFTAVDDAESREAEAYAVNATAVATLAAAADACGASFLQVSTDYVFDGRSTRPYRESDRPNPLSAYGRTKLAGELAAARAARFLIVRTSWLFGAGHNFVEAIRRQLDTGNRALRVVDDQTGCPTYAGDLAAALLDLVEADLQGVFHVANSGATTWRGLAVEIAHQLGFDVEVAPITTAAAARPAPRPAYSVLDTSRSRVALGRELPPWQEGLTSYLRACP